MEQQFKDWLIKRGYSETGAATSYSRAIPQISNHYSHNSEEQIDIFAITDQAKISQIAHDYSQSGKFASFGYEQHGRYRAAISRYSEFFVHKHQIEHLAEASEPDEETVSELEEQATQTNFAYERDLQTTLCAQISELFAGYKIYGESNLGVEYSIGGRRIDVLLEKNETGDLLAVELKSGLANYKVFGQISMYLGLLEKQFPERNISGVIVAGSIDDSLKQACSITDKVTLKIYRMSIELEDS
ncbi:endonuclease NucS domain-containing protein [Vibrio coralliirubri]|uniref:endonuclease NucS domain-containing protein n=1 Tax=Vibrio coralliirubri TaxID=1516159 RepID=UPI000769FBC2|nr:endonuclease NucS domain-containing protein [Vibrio coralliirubri]